MQNGDSDMPQEKSTVEISVIIPAYNEAKVIGRTLGAVAAQLVAAGASYEIIVVDDGSTDGTWEELEAGLRDNPYVHAIKLSRNFGKERAICAGLENAAGQAVLLMDADLQHPPEILPRMIALWRTAGVDIVDGVKRDRGEESRTRRCLAKLFYTLLSRLSGYDFRGASDFKLLDRRVVDAWMRMPEATTFFRGMAAWLGFRRAAVEFDVPARADGASAWGVYSLIMLAVNAMISFSALPLRLVTLAGCVFFFLALALGTEVIYNYVTGVAVSGFTTVILLILILGTVLMGSLGIIGEYIAAIYSEVKGRPRYVISRRIGPGDRS